MPTLNDNSTELSEFQSNKSIVEKYIHCYNVFDVSGMTSCLSESVIFENIVGGKLENSTIGKDEFRSLADQSAKLFLSRTQKVVKLEKVGQKLIAQIFFSALLSNNTSTESKSEKILEITGRSEFEFKDGLVSHIKDII